MTTQWRALTELPADADAAVLPAFTDRLPGPATVPPAFLAGCDFTGQIGEVVQVPAAGAAHTPAAGAGPSGGRSTGPEAAGGGPPTWVLLGLGPGDAVDGDGLRRAAAALARATRRHRRLAITVPVAAGRIPLAAEVRALVEGFSLGGYRFARYKTGGGTPAVERVDVVTTDIEQVRAALHDGRRMAEGVLLARDLVNEPGEALTPSAFAELASAVAAESDLGCEIWDEYRIAAERLGGLLAVSRGSPRLPRLVRLHYQPEHPAGVLALVGKGVTFDAGGLSLKPNAQMVDMKADMAGAAAVLGAMSVLADLGCPIRVEGWLPLTENMPNADPIRIGDVLRMRNGATVEVRNADAEGRLIMADALVLASETRPDAIVDIATLTDAAAIALGRKVAAVMGNDPDLVERLRRAGDRCGEPVWPLPLPDRYRPQLESRVADLVNYTIGTRHGTALLAGLFLREFVASGIPWAHLDIQGTAICDADDGEWVAGGTGFGVRTLAELAMAYGQPPEAPV